jgi:Uma2 family endonuclease
MIAVTMSLAEFLEWEERQELRYEFDGFQPMAMTGGTVAHAIIQRNLAVFVGGRLRGKPCTFFGNAFKIEVAGRIRYPDGCVVCTPLSPRAKRTSNPVVIFEVLSDSTERTDLVAKNREYSETPSVTRYIALTQDEIGGTMFERIGEDWVGHLLSADTVLVMPEIGIELPLAELYDGITFEAAGAS